MKKALLALAVALICTSAAHAGVITVTGPVADVVRSGCGDSDSYIYSQPAWIAFWGQSFFVQLDTSAIPTGSVIQSATLTFLAGGDIGWGTDRNKGTINVYSSSAPLVHGIDGNSALASGIQTSTIVATNTNPYADAPTYGSPVTFDITNYVQGLMNGTADPTLAFVDGCNAEALCGYGTAGNPLGFTQSITYAPTPEPATMGLLLLGGIGALLRRRSAA
jgi:hypothetical protein